MIYKTLHVDSFLIYAPRWRDNAAGIKVLYLLCHELNLRGLNAFIVPIGLRRKVNLPKDLKVRFISEKRRDRRKLLLGRHVVVYSETILGNPLKAQHVIRYFLNYPKLLNPQIELSASEYNLPYSKNIFERLKSLKCSNLADPLFISSIDLREIYKRAEKQNFIIVYASKFRRIYGSPRLQGLDSPTIEIFGRGKRAQKRHQTLELIAKAKALISFENSALQRLY